jgi:hypothetical protein
MNPKNATKNSSEESMMVPRLILKFLNPVTNKYVKILPSNLEDYLTPLALAIWFMDDGSRLKHGGLRIATNNFTKKEVESLCVILKLKYNLICSIHSAGLNKGFILYINKQSKTEFIKLVKPYILPSLIYKLDED